MSAEMNSKDNGTGFVSFNDHVAAKNALEGVNMKKKIGDQSIFVNAHVYRKENELQPKAGGLNPIT